MPQSKTIEKTELISKLSAILQLMDWQKQLICSMRDSLQMGKLIKGKSGNKSSRKQKKKTDKKKPSS